MIGGTLNYLGGLKNLGYGYLRWMGSFGDFDRFRIPRMDRVDEISRKEQQRTATKKNMKRQTMGNQQYQENDSIPRSRIYKEM